MKEFKFCGEITEYVEIPVYVCETQKEMVKEISEIRDVLTFVDEARENLLDTAVSNEEETSVYIIYKDGSIYFKTLDEEEGKFKRYGIKAAVIETAFEYTAYGDFAINDMGDVTIEESEIEEYGKYNGQYDVKEQDEQEVSETETNETTTETETAETAEQETATETDDSGHDKEVFEDETDEIECRCIWYHHNGVKGMIAQDTKRVIKKPETTEVSKEAINNRKEVNGTNFIQQLYDAEYSKTLTVQGGIERFLKLAKEFVKNKSAEMSLIVDTAAQVLHDKYKLDYGTIETLEIEAYNS